MINARVETVAERPAYRRAFERYRCLIVADGFYEWMKAEDPKQPRQPWRFTVDGGEPFALLHRTDEPRRGKYFEALVDADKKFRRNERALDGAELHAFDLPRDGA